ncbi:hypothetical protein ACFVYT_08335 [Streptomyces sp. NPDC058290]|uniref:hypothetical protein n=1 Tax=Streptomyces sp. NPDC058290 TaxID=3346426 RepID=UPI0036E27087
MVSEHPADEDPPEPEVETPVGLWNKWISGSKAWQPLLAALVAAGAAIYAAQLGKNEPPKPPQTEPRVTPPEESFSAYSEQEPIVGLRHDKEEILPSGGKRLSYWGTVDRLALNRRLGILVGPLENVTKAEDPADLLKPEGSLPWGALSIAEVNRKDGTWQLTIVVGKLGSEKDFKPYAVPPGLHEGCTGQHPCQVHYTNLEPVDGDYYFEKPGSDDLDGLEPLPLRDLREVQATPPT